MKSLLIILTLTFAFACHTKVEQAKSGINDPTNVIYGDIDSSVISPASPAETPCIDPAKIDTSAVCTMDYTPVCGCDKVTYSNACMAAKSGVTEWTEGECKK